jgi:hypothetical protein
VYDDRSAPQCGSPRGKHRPSVRSWCAQQPLERDLNVGQPLAEFLGSTDGDALEVIANALRLEGAVLSHEFEAEPDQCRGKRQRDSDEQVRQVARRQVSADRHSLPPQRNGAEGESIACP